MKYVKTPRKNNVTKLNAPNMNHLEQGISDAAEEINKHAEAINKKPDLDAFKTINGEPLVSKGDIDALNTSSLLDYYDKEEVDKLLNILSEKVSEPPNTLNTFMDELVVKDTQE